jgi:chemotaxis protein MotB
MQNNSEAPVRIIKKRSGHGGHHGGAWKVAYADFVTAMMALFIVLWIVGQSKTVRDAVAAYFKDPSGIQQQGAPSILKGGAGSITPQTLPPREPGTAQEGKDEKAALEATAAALKEKIHSQSNLAKLEDKVRIEMVDEGLRIQLVETDPGVFFDVGSSHVKVATRDLLTIIADEIGKLPNDVVVEGHTDGRPYTGAPNYSNWELSADRANAARRILETGGVQPAQVAQVVGYADRQLANAKDPLDAANRRTSIIVRYRKAAAH